MTAWSVTVEFAYSGPIPTDDQLDAFAARLSEFGAAVTGAPEAPADRRARYGAALSVDAEDAVEAVREAADAARRAAAAVGLPGASIVAAEAVEEEALAASLAKPAFPSLLGVRELAQLLAVSPQRASALARSAQFPEPVAQLASGPVWTETSVRLFVEEWQRRPGPRKKTA